MYLQYLLFKNHSEESGLHICDLRVKSHYKHHCSLFVVVGKSILNVLLLNIDYIFVIIYENTRV